MNYDDLQLSEMTSKHLSEHNVCLAFFDNAVEDHVKREMINHLKDQSNGQNLIRAKQFKSTLPEYVTKNSLRYFEILAINTEFLFNIDPSAWATDENYMHAKLCSENLSVTNDCAERAVTISGEFFEIGPKDDTEKNELLLTVDKNRKDQNNSSKASVLKYLSNN